MPESRDPNKVFTQPSEASKVQAQASQQEQPPMGPQPGQSVGTPQQAAAKMLRDEFGIEIPNELVPLPSGGLVYPQGSPLHKVETVDITAMTAREEDILTSKALLKKGTVITELIRSCLCNKAIEPAHMLVGDRNALMIAIRITGYGEEYDAQVTCSNCGKVSKKTFDLSALHIKRLKIAPVAEGTNEFEFRLPVTKIVTRFKFLTGSDEEEILALQDKHKRLNLSTDNNVTTNLTYTLVSANGKTDRAKLRQLANRLPAKDSKALRKYIRDNEPGIDMRCEFECPECDNVGEAAMPIGINFLWPDAVR